MKGKYLAFIALLSICGLNAAQQVWRYQLLEGSTLVDQCFVCARPDMLIPMRGSFMLRLVEEGPFETQYAIENADFQAGDYHFTGEGSYQISGAVALIQSMTLSGDVQTPSGAQAVYFESQQGNFSRPMPMIVISVTQTNGTDISTFQMNIAAAPLREIWFSTTSGFTRAIRGLLDNTVSSGELISTAGRVVKRNSDLQEKFPGPTYENMGLDAIDILPGAEIVFSTDTIGILSDGDFANARAGAIVRWQDFMSVAGDPGLDALQFETPTRFYFSVKTNASPPPEGIPGSDLFHGDIILADLETREFSIFKKNEQLLARFHPPELGDYGLDALYIWPSGEIWFSITSGFQDSQLGPISSGDLLSDGGHIIYRNLDLLAALQPVEDLNNFGLDAVTIISDAVAATESPTLGIVHDRANDSTILTWKGKGRVFQVERARDLAGPWEQITQIISELRYEDSDAVQTKQKAFYRVRQW